MASDEDKIEWFQKLPKESWVALRGLIGSKLKGTSAVHTWGSVQSVVNNLYSLPRLDRKVFIQTIGRLYDIAHGMDPNVALANPGDESKSPSRLGWHTPSSQHQKVSTSESCVLRAALELL